MSSPRASEMAVIQFLAVACILLATRAPIIQAFLSGQLAWAVTVPAAAFVVLYKGLVTLYMQFGWRFLFWRSYVGGRWIYGGTNERGEITYGTFLLVQNRDSLEFRDARTWRGGNPPRPGNHQGIWDATLAHMDGMRITILVTGTRADNKIPVLRQLVEISMERTPQGPEASGILYALAHPAGSFARLEAKRLRHRDRHHAAQAAFRTYGQEAIDTRNPPLNAASPSTISSPARGS